MPRSCLFVNTLASEHHVPYGSLGRLEPIQGLSEIDDMDAVSLREDELTHLRVPTASLMPKVDSSLEQFVQADLLLHALFHEINAC